jgi:hypothetical protein
LRMAWPWLTIIASNIPWVELVRRAPDILDGSRRLLDKSRKLEHHAPSSSAQAAELQLRDRVATLEAREVEQAKVVEQMAEQLQGLTVSVKVLAARNKLLIYIVVVLAVAVLVMTASVLSRPR